MPASALRHAWQHPNAPWDRVHIDDGEWKNHHFLVLVNSFSKWPEVKVVSTTTTQMTINVLSDIFLRPMDSPEFLFQTIARSSPLLSLQISSGRITQITSVSPIHKWAGQEHGEKC